LGIVVIGGDAVASLGDLGTLHLFDVAPTLLSLCEVPIPSWLEGDAVEVRSTSDAPLSDEEQAILQQHLSGLGYFG
jgi:hypothetical protein